MFALTLDIIVSIAFDDFSSMISTPTNWIPNVIIKNSGNVKMDDIPLIISLITGSS